MAKTNKFYCGKLMANLFTMPAGTLQSNDYYFICDIIISEIIYFVKYLGGYLAPLIVFFFLTISK